MLLQDVSQFRESLVTDREMMTFVDVWLDNVPCLQPEQKREQFPASAEPVWIAHDR